MQLKSRVTRHLILSLGFILLLGASALAAEALPPKRIITLTPNTTEIVFALGLGDRLVGVSSFSDFPKEALKITKVGPMNSPSIEAIITLSPDLVILSTDGNRSDFKYKLEKLGIPTFVIKARRLDELPGDIRVLAKGLGKDASGEALAREIEKSILTLTTEGTGKKNRSALFIVWPEPLIVAGPGTLIHDALKIIGLTNIAEDSITEYPKFSIEAIIQRSPEIIFISTSHANIRELSNRLLKKLKSTRAVKNNRVYYTGDEILRLGPRTIAGIEELRGFRDE
jgi:iron complex transport system substrate-binding protein